MKKTIIIFFLFLSSIAVNAQSNELLTGKWVFKKALNKEVDDHGKNSMNSEVINMINKMTFDFKSNGDFTLFLSGVTRKGKWMLSENSKGIILNMDQEKMEFLILKLV